MKTTSNSSPETCDELPLETLGFKREIDYFLLYAAETVYDQAVPGKCLDSGSYRILAKLSKMLEEAKEKCRDNSRTSCVWIQYMTMVDILKNYIRAERTGDWKMHLKSMKDILPYFAAAGRASSLH